MWLINPIIDTDSIGKYIWQKIYTISDKMGISQIEIAKKIWVSQANISAFFTGKRTTTNLDQYWRIAEAIPISRSEFDRIVEDAKRHVIGDLWWKNTNEDPDVAYATLARSYGVSPDDVKKAMEMYKLYKN